MAETTLECGCKVHSEDRNGTHGGRPHIHYCQGHRPELPSGVLGIDPGKAGGIVLLRRDAPPRAHAMPETEAAVVTLLRELNPMVEVAYIEAVHSMPRDGVRQAFTFGRGYGFLRGVLMSLHVPFIEVRPIVWQDTMGARTGGDKNVSKRRAQELFPDVNVTLKTADALLIAAYGVGILRQDSSKGGLTP